MRPLNILDYLRLFKNVLLTLLALCPDFCDIAPVRLVKAPQKFPRFKILLGPSLRSFKSFTCPDHQVLHKS